MSHGVIIGKFDPFHMGHVLCIAAAMVNNEYVTIMVVDSVTNTYPILQRAKWISDLLLDTPEARVVIIDDIYDDENSIAWADHMTKALAGVFGSGLNSATDLYGSEDYITPCANAMGATPHLVDPERITCPISATQIRQSPILHRGQLPSTTRGYFTRPIVVCGAESTGTTTLASVLAAKLEVEFVPEYGRTYCEKLPNEHEWTHREFLHIAATQTQHMLAAARKSTKHYFISDTNALTTHAFEKVYTGYNHTETLKIANISRMNFYEAPLYIITYPTIPFVQDGLRLDDPDKQFELHNEIVSTVNWTSHPDNVLLLETPDLDERIALAEKFIEETI